MVFGNDVQFRNSAPKIIILIFFSTGANENKSYYHDERVPLHKSIFINCLPS